MNSPYIIGRSIQNVEEKAVNLNRPKRYGRFIRSPDDDEFAHAFVGENSTECSMKLKYYIVTDGYSHQIDMLY